MTEGGGPPHAIEDRLRDLSDSDTESLLALNNASVPHVNQLERADLDALLAKAAYAHGIVQGEKLLGALIALWPGTDYASDNYRWFDRHHNAFLYIDRVMIDGGARKAGLGRRLYADIERFAVAEGAGHLACEVNSEPPNPVSMGFHEYLGFRPVGELANKDRSKAVVLMMKAIGDH